MIYLNEPLQAYMLSDIPADIMAVLCCASRQELGQVRMALQQKFVASMSTVCWHT